VRNDIKPPVELGNLIEQLQTCQCELSDYMKDIDAGKTASWRGFVWTPIPGQTRQRDESMCVEDSSTG